MATTAVADGVSITLKQLRAWLRLNPIQATVLGSAASLGETSLDLGSVLLLTAGDYITLGNDSYEISSVDYGLDTITLATALVANYSVQTPVMTHPSDAVIMQIYKSAKDELDRFLDNEFTEYDSIPEDIVRQVYKLVQLDFDNPSARVTRQSIDDVGSVTYGEERHMDVLIYRSVPL